MTNDEPNLGLGASMPERLAYSPTEAAHLLGCTRQTIYKLMARGELRSVKVGRLRRITSKEIRRLLELDDV